MQRLVLPSTLAGTAGLDVRLLQLTPPRTDPDVLVDAAAVSFVRPSGLAHVYVAAFSLVERGYNVSISEAQTRRAQEYMRRAHFWQSLRDCGADVPSEMLGYAYGNNPGLIECSMIRTTPDLQEVMRQNDELKDRFELALQRAGVRRNRSSMVWAELCGNAAEHSRSPHGAFVMAQVYEGREIEIAVADVGRGIRSSLAHLNRYSTDREAIAAAIVDGVTGRVDSGGAEMSGGWGLYGVRADAHRLFIRSGAARLRNFTGTKNPEGVLEMLPGRCFPLQGTLVTATIFAPEQAGA